MKHGASAYVYHRCRCKVCTAANTARVREYRKSRTTASPSGPLGTTPGNQIAPATAPTAPGHGNQEDRS